MKLLTSTSDLTNEFRRLLKSYQSYSWLIAWAGKPFELTDLLEKYSSRARKVVIGLHFYQTHPDFIKKFMINEHFRFIKQTQGTYHSKIYYFENSVDDWELLIGSSNFTNAAFSCNTETNVLISSKSPDAVAIRNQILNQIESSWNIAKEFSINELEEYRTIYANQERKINSLSSTYGSMNKVVKPVYTVPVLTMNWEDYAQKVLNDKYNSVDERLRILEKAQKIFHDYSRFEEMPTIVRKAIAGTYNGLKDGDDWYYFGSMQGAGRFKNRIIENDKKISLALDQIPLSGQVTRTHFEEYLRYFLTESDLNPIATATRLLTLKRPDIFVCLDNMNIRSLSKAFEIPHSEVTLEKYWDLIIERIFDSEWWLNPRPRNQIEQKISNNRSAMLDSLYYEKK
jgi:hypothetical protein